MRSLCAGDALDPPSRQVPNKLSLRLSLSHTHRGTTVTTVPVPVTVTCPTCAKRISRDQQRLQPLGWRTRDREACAGPMDKRNANCADLQATTAIPFTGLIDASCKFTA